MHEHLSTSLFWQMQARHHATRIYRGGGARRATLTARFAGRLLLIAGRGLQSAGNWLQGDGIPAAPQRSQPVGR